jgi:DNA-directed RNA polymerase subunit M/transcription elongation factor TFIIS/polyhydroxyalkanoate synthesis regulator phasin
MAMGADPVSEAPVRITSLSDVARREGLSAGMFRQRTIKEVERIRGVLQQNETKPNDQVLEEALVDLSELCIDREVLAKTSIGKHVSKLKKGQHDRIRSMSGNLVDQWKHDHERRQKVVDVFVEKGKGAITKRNAVDMEDGLFDEACPLGILEGEGWKEYQRHFKRLCTHLRATGPGSMICQLEERIIKFTEVAALPDSQLISDEQGQKRLQDQEEGLKAAISSTGMEGGTETEEYECPKCKCVRTQYKEMQTGWHDDNQDLTIRVRCMDCFHTWKATDDHGGAA